MLGRKLARKVSETSFCIKSLIDKGSFSQQKIRKGRQFNEDLLDF